MGWLSGLGRSPLTCYPSLAVQLTLPPGLQMALGPGREYQALQLHLHWGAAGRPGSEHTVGGHRFPAEVSSSSSSRGAKGGAGEGSVPIPTHLSSPDPRGAPQHGLCHSGRGLGAPRGPGRAGRLSAGRSPGCPPTPVLPMSPGSVYFPPETHPSTLTLAPAYPHSLLSSFIQRHSEGGIGPNKGFRNCGSLFPMSPQPVTGGP